LLSNYIKNFKLDLSILLKILFSLNFKNIILFKLIFDFENNILFDSINFNKFSKVTKLLNTLQNLLFANFDLIVQKYLELQLY